MSPARAATGPRTTPPARPGRAGTADSDTSRPGGGPNEEMQ
ncbi:hypothetical protein ABZZ17_28880 [Streptomyces sp. NPDC006512]